MNTIVAHEISEQVKDFISYRMQKKLEQELFRSRTAIKPAIDKLQQDIIEMKVEINQNERAISFLKEFKEFYND